MVNFNRPAVLLLVENLFIGKNDQSCRRKPYFTGDNYVMIVRYVEILGGHLNQRIKPRQKHLVYDLSTRKGSWQPSLLSGLDPPSQEITNEFTDFIIFLSLS